MSIRMHIVTCFDKTVLNEHPLTHPLLGNSNYSCLSGMFLVDIHGVFSVDFPEII